MDFNPWLKLAAKFYALSLQFNYQDVDMAEIFVLRRQMERRCAGVVDGVDVGLSFEQDLDGLGSALDVAADDAVERLTALMVRFADASSFVEQYLWPMLLFLFCRNFNSRKSRQKF